MNKFLLLILIIVCAGKLTAQTDTLTAPVKIPQDYLSEFRVTFENDAFVFTFHDGYYTNGLFLQYSHAVKTKSNTSAIKKIVQYQLGQMVFNSENFKNDDISEIDRPFSGYLFFGYGSSRFYKKGNLLTAAVEAGASGKASFAQQVQVGYHHVLGIYEVRGWGFALNSEWALNARIKYYLHLLKPERINKVDLHLTGTLTAGNTFTNASMGPLFRYGSFENPENSSFFNARTGTGTAKKLKYFGESFFFFQPQIMWQGYNATVQGPLFNNVKGLVVSGITRVLYMHQWGFFISGGRMSGSITFTKKQKEATTMIHKKEKYGSIMVAYRFGSPK